MTKRIVVFAHQGAGDLLMMVPALKALSGALGRPDKLWIVVNTRFEASVARQIQWKCDVDYVLVGKTARSRLWSLARFILGEAIYGLDVVVAPHLYDRLSNAIIIASLNATVSVGRPGRWIGKVFTRLVDWDLNNFQHQVEFYNRCFERSGLVGAINETVVLSVADSDLSWANSAVGAGNELLIGFGPGASRWQMQKCWPLRYYGRLAAMICSRFERARIVLVGGSEDVDLFDEIVQSSGICRSNFLIFSGLEFRRSLAVIKKCACFVSGTTGLGHMAAAADVPLIVTCVPTNPSESGPWSTKAWTLTATLKCAPCYRDGFKLCGEFECMGLISPERVFDTLLKALAGESPIPFIREKTKNAAGYLRLRGE